MDANTLGNLVEDLALSIETVWVGLKLVYLVLFGLYLAFAIVVVAQVKQMLMALSGGFDRGLKFLAWGHLALAAGAFILALVIL